MTQYVYFGTYTHQRGGGHRPQGIYQYRWDAQSGSLEFAAAYGEAQNPSFLAVHPTKRFLFSVNELGGGGASAFAVEAGSGSLTFLNSQSTNGAHPCYLSCDPSGRWLLAANYSSGSLSVFPIGEDGQLGPLAEHVQHEGKGTNPRRQERTHAHSIRFDPSGRFVLAADLGIDQLLVYRLDEKTGKLTPNDPPALHLHPGAGPRHFAFDPQARCVYIANELDSTVTACTWDSQRGAMKTIQSLSTLPEDFSGESTVADIHFTPDGKYLYVSNRGHDSLAIYTANSQTGLLTLAGFAPAGGKTPRNFAIAPDGRYLLCANQDSDNVVIFRIDADSGFLTPTGQEVSVPLPVCVLFVDL
jgi:6-phosphogluconolactonase